MIKGRVESVLTKAGLIALPEKTDGDLSYYGLNSLTLALSIVELEKEFKIKIPVLPIDKNKFISIDTIERYVKGLGGQ